MNRSSRTVLWWGRFDPDYSRNRILRQAYAQLGWRVVDFHPWLAGMLGDLEARLRPPPAADLVHIPCFRQRDIAAAARYARAHHLPLLLDTLTSQFDKQVYEQRRFAPRSWRARHLLRYEQRLFANADIVLADTPEHARFFADALLVPEEKLHVVYVGAEEPLFSPGPACAPNNPIEVLFYGTFIPLQGPEVIVEAARRYQGPPVRWVLLGVGPLRRRCQQLAARNTNVTFEDWVPYAALPSRIARADILLGVFGDTAKAQRVIPNKVFQSMACGKPLVTCTAPGYPPALVDNPESGIRWVPAGEPRALAAAVATLAAEPQRLAMLGARTRASYEQFFSNTTIVEQLRAALEKLTPARG
ncbi:MAG TPA: glycosyltransferase [Acidiferrobacterales bacterium]|nr:glycosyltransferase [Acidiferrobacterales bacterium]